MLDTAAELRVPRAGVLRLSPLGRARAHGRELAPRRPDQTAAPDVLRVPEAVHLVTS